jgi:hypothetical protein
LDKDIGAIFGLEIFKSVNYKVSEFDSETEIVINASVRTVDRVMVRGDRLQKHF